MPSTLPRFIRIAAAAVTLASAIAAPQAAGAHEYKLGPITIESPWTRATTVRTGAAYMTVKLSGQTPDQLVKVSTPDAERVEIHTMAIEDGVSRMREVKSIALKPGATIHLRPGGLHLMMVGLKRPLREGEAIKLSLTFENAGTVDVEATVEKAGSPGGHKH